MRRTSVRPPVALVDWTGALVAFGVIAALATAVGTRTLPGEVLVAGAATGALSGLVAVGLVLVHRTQRIISFAAAAVGAPAAGLGLSLLARGWAWPVATAAVLVVAPIAGLGCELVVRRFAGQARSVATVVTVGLAQVVLGLELVLTSAVSPDGALPPTITTPFSRYEWQLGIARITGDHACAALAAASLVTAVVLVLACTDLGLALRAVASRPQRAAGLGLSVSRTTQVIWVLGAVLAAVALFLRAPIAGAATGGALGGPTVLLPALLAAAVARFEDVRRAFLAAVVVGGAESAAVFATGRANAAVAVVALGALGATLCMPRLRSRGELAAAALWSAAAEPRRLPGHLATSPVARVLRVTPLALGVAFLVGLPLLLDDADAGRLTIAALYGLLALAVVVASGWGGQLHLGVAGAAAVGALVAGGLATRQAGPSGDFVVTIAAAALAGAAASILGGLPALRRPGVLSGVSTLALATGVAALVDDPWLGAVAPPAGALVGRPILFSRWDLTGALAFHFACVAALALGVLLCRSFRASRVHRLVVAARDDRRFLAPAGSPPAAPVLTVLATSGLLAGLAGGLLAYHQGSVDASTFAPALGIDVLTVVVAGGVTAPAGAIGAAATLVALPMMFPGVPAVVTLTSGAGLVLVLLLVPGGIAQGAARLRLGLCTWAAGRAGAHGAPVAATGATQPLSARPALELPAGAVAFEVARTS